MNPFEAGEWTEETFRVGGFGEFEPGKATLVADDEEDPALVVLFPFPSPDLEYGSVRVTTPQPQSRKRPRAAATTTIPQPITQEERAFAAASRVLLDSKAKKPTVALVHGEGLRIPEHIGLPLSQRSPRCS